MNDIINIEEYEHRGKNMWYYMYPETDKADNLPYFLHSIGLHELQPPIAKPHGHEYDQFFYSTHGTGTLILNGKRYTVKEGYGFFIPQHIPHEYFPSENVWDIRWMVPRGNSLSDLYSMLNITGGIYALNDTSPLDIILDKMHKELIYNKDNGNLFASSHVCEFIMEFARQAMLLDDLTPFALQPDSDIGQKHIALLKDYINYHFMHRITMAELCRLTNLSAQHLCRIFKKYIGMRPTEYILSIRIERAKELLSATNHSINDISLWCGFENNNYFWNSFKRLTGMTPGQYRLSHKPQI